MGELVYKSPNPQPPLLTKVAGIVGGVVALLSGAVWAYAGVGLGASANGDRSRDIESPGRFAYTFLWFALTGLFALGAWFIFVVGREARWSIGRSLLVTQGAAAIATIVVIVLLWTHGGIGTDLPAPP